MVIKKSWNRNKVTIKVGECEMCHRKIYSKDGNWIINAAGKYFCDDIEKEDSCFDKYLVSVKDKPSKFSHYENFLQRREQFYSAAKMNRR